MMLSTTSESRQQHPSRSSQRTWGFIAAGLLAAVYLLTSVLIASHRLFWYDEIFTVTISQLPDFANIWKTLAHAADMQPPTYYMLVKIFDYLPIRPEVAARLPS